MSDAFLGRLVASESMVIKTNDLAVALKKVSSEGIKGLSMEEGPSKFKLPSNLGDIGGANVNAKVRRVCFVLTSEHVDRQSAGIMLSLFCFSKYVSSLDCWQKLVNCYIVPFLPLYDFRNISSFEKIQNCFYTKFVFLKLDAVGGDSYSSCLFSFADDSFQFQSVLLGH